MIIRPSELQLFNGKKVLAEVAGNLKSVEDIDSIRELLTRKYGAENVIERTDSFLVNGKLYIKPWLPRTRTGTFHVKGDMYYIQATERSTEEGRIKPRKSFFPLTALSMQDSKTLVAMVNVERNEYLTYTLVNG